MERFSGVTEGFFRLHVGIVWYVINLFKKSQKGNNKKYRHSFRGLRCYFEDLQKYVGFWKETLSEEQYQIVSRLPLPEFWKEEKDLGDNDEQFFEVKKNHFPQNGEVNLLFELIYNQVCESINIPMTLLAVIDKKSGKYLIPEFILPNGYDIMPSFLRQGIKKFDEEQAKIISVPEIRSLKNYNGSQNEIANDGFRAEYCNKDFKYVCYGNLSKKGGILSLFHEIIHTWQFVFWDKGCAKKFDDFIFKCCSLLHFYSKKQREYELTGDLLDFISAGEVVSERLKKYGLSLFERDDEYQCVSVEINNFAMREGYCIFAEKVEILSAIIKNFELAERTAWAYSVKLIRYLRKRGIDPEPELRSLEDFKSIYEPCLQTYQQHVSDTIKIQDRPVKFVCSKT